MGKHAMVKATKMKTQDQIIHEIRTLASVTIYFRGNGLLFTIADKHHFN